MTESKILSVTVKTPESERFAGDNPWFVFEGEPQTIGQNVISTFGLTNVSPDATLAEIVLAAQTVLTATANAVRGGAQTAPPVAPFQQPAPSTPPAQQGWGNPPVQEVVPSWAAQSAQPQQPQAAPAAPPPPSAAQCPGCGASVAYKAFTSKAGKDIKMWSCPNQKSKGDGHFSEFIN